MDAMSQSRSVFRTGETRFAFCIAILAAQSAFSGTSLSAQVNDQGKARTLFPHRQRFKFLDGAYRHAEEVFDKEWDRPFGVLIYVLPAEDGQPPSFRSRLKFLGKYAGYIGAADRPKDVVFWPVHIPKSETASAFEVRIIAPGYEEYVRRAIIHPGELIVWDDIALERLTERSAAAVVGRVWLENVDDDLEGIVIYVDGEPVAFTDAGGRFVADPVRPGKLRISGHKGGYLGLYKELSVGRNEEARCELRGYRPRYALVRWAYQPDGTRSFRAGARRGVAVLSRRDLSRVKFKDGFHDVDRASDFLMTQEKDRLVLRHFDMGGPKGPASIRIKDPAEDIWEAPEFGYTQTAKTFRANDVIVIRCFDGKHYGMIEVLDVSDKRPSLDEDR